MNTTPALPADMATPKPRPGRWLRTFGWLFFAWVVVSVFTIVWLFGQLLPAPVEITVNGTSVAAGLDLAGLPTAHKLALALVAAVAALIALLFGVAVLVAAAAALVPVLLLIVGLPVLVGGVVLLALLSPFVLLGWMLWRAARLPRPAAMTP
jgi:hypothetical protein